jgi:hypothetical protein
VTRKVEKAGVGFWCLPGQSAKDIKKDSAPTAPPATSASPASPDNGTADQSRPAPRSKRGRKRGWRDPDVARRKKEMLDAWDQCEYTSKANAGAAFGFHKSDATKLINQHMAKRR